MEDERRKQTEQKLLACGRAEFLEKGYAKASLRDICKAAGVTTGDDNERQIMEYLSAHRTEAIILMDRCAGSRYEGFRRQIEQQMQAAFTGFFSKYMDASPDKKLIEILVSMRLQGYLELIKGDYTVEERVQLAREIGVHADAGTAALIKYLNEQKEVYRR